MSKNEPQNTNPRSGGRGAEGAVPKKEAYQTFYENAERMSLSELYAAFNDSSQRLSELADKNSPKPEH